MVASWLPSSTIPGAAASAPASSLVLWGRKGVGEGGREGGKEGKERGREGVGEGGRKGKTVL